MKISVLAVGTELTTGQIVNKNSSWISKKLKDLGVLTSLHLTVPDDRSLVLESLQICANHSDIIFVTGGLGPTADDITKPLLCKYFGGKLVVDEGAKQNVLDIFTKLNRPIIDRNLKQAEVPDVCTVLQNKRGTAPRLP